MGVMAFFSYWDTFLATFMPIFFTEVLREQEGWLQHIPGSLLMLVFILPILGLLPFVAKMGDKIGREFFMIAGIVLTAIFSFVIGIVSTEAFLILFIGGFGIAFGYLFGMSSAKAQAAYKINQFSAKNDSKKKENEDDSAGHIMLVDNVGNIIGPLLGGLLIQVLGFQRFFLLFSFLLMSLAAFTAWKKSILVEEKKK
jgi:MFS family permease